MRFHQNNFLCQNHSCANGDVFKDKHNPAKPSVKPRDSRDLDSRFPVSYPRFSVAAVLVFAASVLCFSNCYDGEFVHDDKWAILNNKDLRPETPLSSLFKNDFWGNRMDAVTSHKSYRPLTVLTFRLSYCLGGGHSPPWFHIPNIILHGINSVLLLPVFYVLFGSNKEKPADRKIHYKPAESAFLCALLFAVHPIHTESVCAVVGRADLLCATLFLLSFLLYIKTCSTDLCQNDKLRPSKISIPCIVWSAGLSFLSMLCKEQGITVLGICSVYDMVQMCGLDPLQLFNMRRKRYYFKQMKQFLEKSNCQASLGFTNIPNLQTCASLCFHLIFFLQIFNMKPWVLPLIKRQVILITTGLLSLMFRCHMMGSTQPNFVMSDNPHSFQNGAFIRGLNYNYLYSINAWLLVHPLWLCFDWSMGCVPVIETVLDTRIICAGAFWIVIGALLYTCFKTPVTGVQRVLTIALAFVVLPFLPASNIFFRVGFVIAERVLYLSSIGFCMLMVLGISQICAVYPKLTQMVKVAFVFLICIFAIRCTQRSSQWRTAMELHLSGEKVCPLNAKVHYNIGKLVAANGNKTLAEEKYRLALKLDPTYPGALNNLGILLSDKGDMKEAEKLLRTAVEAKKQYEGQKLSGVANSLTNLGNLYLKMNQFDKAVETWKSATIHDPTLPSAWTNMAFQLDLHGRHQESLEIAARGLKYLPKNDLLHFNLGNIYARYEEWLKSETHYLMAVKLNPGNSMFYANLGVLYAKWGKYDRAESNYRKALSLNPNDLNVKQNLEMLKR